MFKLKSSIDKKRGFIYIKKILRRSEKPPNRQPLWTLPLTELLTAINKRYTIFVQVYIYLNGQTYRVDKIALLLLLTVTQTLTQTDFYR